MWASALARADRSARKRAAPRSTANIAAINAKTDLRNAIFPARLRRMKPFLLALISSLFMAAVTVHAEPVPATAAPAWKLKDLDGKVVSSETFKGKVVVLDFWATWCPPCRAEIPGYVDLQKKYGKDGLVVIGVSLDDGPAVVKTFVAKFGVNYQIVMGNEKTAEIFGGVEAIPTTFIIDRKGEVREIYTGYTGTITGAYYADYVAKFNKLLDELIAEPNPYAQGSGSSVARSE